MKKILMTALLLAPLCGCQMLPNYSSDSELAYYRSIARVASYTGASLYLDAHPEARQKFIMAEAAVAALAGSGEYDPIALREAMAATLPTDELRGDRTAILISAAFLMFEDLNGQMSPVTTPDQVKAFAIGIKDGLNMALKMTTPKEEPAGALTLPTP